MSARPPVLRFVRTLAATPEEVFDAWTDPSSLRVWMCPGAVEETVALLDVRVGGRLRIVMREPEREHVHTGEYLEVERPRRLAFTWVSVATRGQVTRVAITLRKLAESVAPSSCSSTACSRTTTPGGVTRAAGARSSTSWTTIYLRESAPAHAGRKGAVAWIPIASTRSTCSVRHHDRYEPTPVRLTLRR